MGKYEKLVKQVRDLISNNQTGEALEILAKEQLSSLDKELIILNSRFSKLEEDQRLGIVDENSAQIRLNKINVDLLNLSERIGESISVPEVEEKTVSEPPQPSEKTEDIKKEEPAKVKPKKASEKRNKETTPTPKPAEKSNSKKFILIGITVLVLAGAIGGGIMWSQQNAEKAKVQEKARIEAANKKREQAKRDSIQAAARAKAEKDSLDRIKKIVKGKKFEGGIIFYIDDSGQHGLVYAQGDLTPTKITWFDGPIEKAGAFDTGIYDGKRNTEKLVKKFGDGNYPAKLCDDFEFEGFSDWYLPSQEELDLLWEFTAINRSNSSIVKHRGFTDDYYWSSTEINGEDVYYRSFFNKGQYTLIGRNRAKVRPIRKF